ncbi:MAG: TAXI family TRAP transporter solute-binding subunit [Gammaproteobacteria bacterium]|nr:TAXI family TRAP transporter solute-binding subunit [Gammaproteobacteria bacterium]
MNSRLISVVSWLLVIVAIAAVAIYSGGLLNQKKQELRISAASKGGYYYEFGEILANQLSLISKYSIDLQQSKGSVDNSKKLISDKADLAIVQVSAVASSLSKLEVIAPLWHDYVHVLVRNGRGIKKLSDLKGRKVALGGSGSGHRASAARILPYYGIELTDLKDNTSSYRDLYTDKTIEATIITTTLANPVVNEAIASGEFHLIPIPAPEGFSFHNSDYEFTKIPPGVYPMGDKPQPEDWLPTLRSLAVLASKKGLDGEAVASVLDVLYSIETRTLAPIMLDKRIGTTGIWTSLPVHETSKRYFDPMKSVSSIASTVENIINASTFMFIILGVAIVVIVNSVRRVRLLRERRERAEADTLQALFTTLLNIEANSRRAKDLRLLKEYLYEAQAVKEKGMNAAFSGSMNNSVLFSTFIFQANQIISHLEYRLQFGSELYQPAAIAKDEAVNETKAPADADVDADKIMDIA